MFRQRLRTITDALRTRGAKFYRRISGGLSGDGCRQRVAREGNDLSVSRRGEAAVFPETPPAREARGEVALPPVVKDAIARTSKWRKNHRPASNILPTHLPDISFARTFKVPPRSAVAGREAGQRGDIMDA